MTEEFKKAFSNLSVEEKRYQISNELIIISELIKTKEKQLNLPSVLSVKNYLDNSNITETEMLDFIYEDIYGIDISTFTYVDEDIIVPDIKPDILKTISTSGNVCIYKKEVF